MCVLLVEGKTGRILEEKRELAKRGTDDDNGARRKKRGVEQVKGRREKWDAFLEAPVS